MYHRRPTLVPTLLACTMAAGLHAASIHNRQYHQVDLEDLKANPMAYQGLNVQFRCTFVQSADLYTPFHTPFSPERYINLVVWDDDAALWEPEVRADPVMSLYYDKDNRETALLQNLKTYDVVTIAGEVVATYRDQPWIDIDSIERADDVAQFDDVTVQLLERAEELTEAGEYELAEQDYAAAQDKSLPEHARIAVLYRRALNLFAAGSFEEGVPYLADALQAYEAINDDELTVSRARMHHAMARAQQVLAERSQGAQAQEYYQKGIEHARAAITQNPDLGRAHAVLGICLAGIGDLEQARLRCHRAVRMLPEDADVRWHLGRIYHQQNDHDLAVETLKRAIDLAPKDYRIHKTIAAVYFDRGRSSATPNLEDIILALREYDIAIRLEPEDPDLYYLSGQVIEYAAEEGIEVRIGTQMVPATPELAVKRYIQCLAADSSYVPAYVELGGYYRQQEQHADALSHYQSAVDLQPEDIELRTMLG
ncbi:MAG: tetratricopeptide repeat protein, partial [Planctomycetota bacterium]